MVSGSLSLPCSGFFSPFPHGTGSLSVSWEYLALADGPARFIQGFPCPALLRIPLSKNYLTCTGLSPSTAQLSSWFQFSNQSNIVVLQPRHCRNNIGLGFSTFARRYSQNHSCFLLLRLLRCFSSPGLPPVTNATGYYVFNIVGFPIRTPADHIVCADPRGFSQLITSFIASRSLGILHTPLSNLSPCLVFFARSLSNFKIRVSLL